ncbi:MAG TPA: two-component regulator propeller domain-containing protein [Mucilaginibacter sp.]|jgi:signal transduction histidine kinase/ligand-binding sensor domain-containing protein
MRFGIFIFLSFLSVSSTAARSLNAFTDSDRNVITDYPQALQKAGVKKIRCIFKDSRKFIWIGSENGLYRYDGINVDILQHDAANPHSLPNNTVVAITEDRAGNIWAGTLEGVAQINPRSFVCKVFKKRFHNLDQDFDIKLYIDPDGKLWAGGSNGLDRFDEKKNRFIKVWQYKVKGASGVGYINCLTDWKNDTLAFGTFDGAVLISKRNFGFRRVRSGNRLTVTRILTDEHKRLWLGTWGYGCFVTDSTCTKFTMIAPEKERPNELANVVTGIISTNYDHHKALWMATLQGVYKVNGFMNEISPREIPVVTMMWKGFAGNIMADDEQYIWEAGGTISRFFAGSTFFKTMPVDYKGNVEDIRPLNINGNINIAVSSWYSNSGLIITDLEGKTIYKQQPQSRQDNANISGVAQDKFKRLWISSLAGIEVLGEDFKPVYNSEKVNSAKDKLSSPKTNDVIINHDTAWIACYKKGIDLYDLSFHKIKTFLPGDGSGLTDDYIQRIFADSRGKIWLCGNRKLFKYQGQGQKLKAFNFNKDSTDFTVNCITELPDGSLLIASTSGLFKFNSQNGKYSRITSPLIDDNVILAVSVDDNDDVWFINSEHLIRYQAKSNHFTLFGHEDGLNTSQDLQWMSVIGKSHFFLAANNQIVTFQPGSGAHNSIPVKPYFHDIQVNDSTLARGSFTNSLKLKYNENRLNIGFGAINYIKPEQNLYAYQLTGVDDEWIYTSHNFASYANLVPGTYTLKLKAENYQGIWCTPISMTIVVSPPFWATWWFRLLSFILISSLLFIAIRYVLQRNLREKILKLEKEQAVEKERNRIARDMHDDLGSGLTKIAILSEVAKTQIGSPEYASASLDVISNESRELVDNLQDIIWVLNPKNDSLNSLILYIKEYAESFFAPAVLDYEFSSQNADEQITLSEEQRRNIFLAVKESCNNILKHANCSKVHINVRLHANSFIISVNDNGHGFDTDKVGVFSNGLQNIRNRMYQIGAVCTVISNKNDGTTVTLTVPI